MASLVSSARLYLIQLGRILNLVITEKCTVKAFCANFSPLFRPRDILREIALKLYLNMRMFPRELSRGLKQKSKMCKLIKQGQVERKYWVGFCFFSI